jgi:hemoglobin
VAEPKPAATSPPPVPKPAAVTPPPVPKPAAVTPPPPPPPTPKPAAKPTEKPATKPEAAKKSLYDRLGGAKAIRAVVDEFVARAAADDANVNFFRKGTAKEWKPSDEDVEKLKVHLVNQIGSATGGPEKYEGRAMKEIHTGMKISEAQFNALAGHLSAALDKFSVPKAEKDELIGIVASTKGDIVEPEAK